MSKRPADAPPKSGQAPAIRWNDEEMQTTYANICNVASTREEVSLFFGTNESWQSGASEVEVKLRNRILLSPFAAKRLLLLLERVLGEYEARFGPIAVESDAAARGAAVAAAAAASAGGGNGDATPKG